MRVADPHDHAHIVLDQEDAAGEDLGNGAYEMHELVALGRRTCRRPASSSRTKAGDSISARAIPTRRSSV